jgi:hypothetical protein
MPVSGIRPVDANVWLARHSVRADRQLRADGTSQYWQRSLFGRDGLCAVRLFFFVGAGMAGKGDGTEPVPP